VNLEDAKRQKSGQLELPLEGRGEAPRVERSGEASTAEHGNERSGTEDARLMERVVQKNKGRMVVRSSNRPVSHGTVFSLFFPHHA